MTPLLHVDKLTHYFGGLRAVHNYNLSVGPNQIVGLIGPNGAGKTTVFNLITGVYTPTQGHITLENESIVGLETNEIAAKELGRTFQNLALWRHMNVLDHIKMAHYSQLTYGLFDAFFNTGPGGEQQMLAVGRGYMSGRKLMILDEPSMGLAPLLMLEMFDALREINKYGTTILLVEQNARLALKFAQRGYVIEHGELVLEGPADKLLDDPEVKKAYLGA